MNSHDRFLPGTKVKIVPKDPEMVAWMNLVCELASLESEEDGLVDLRPLEPRPDAHRLLSGDPYCEFIWELDELVLLTDLEYEQWMLQRELTR